MNISQEEFTKRVGENLAKYRKYNGLTQVALADKLNYSDKAISKWENGECLPDIYVLDCIAKLYGVTVNDILSLKSKPKTGSNKLKQFFAPALSCCIVWVVALLVFFITRVAYSSFDKHWLVFIIAIPISSIITLVFSCIYKNLLIQYFSISIIIWTTILVAHIIFINFSKEILTLYYLGIPLQAIFSLWYLYKHIAKRKNKRK